MARPEVEKIKTIDGVVWYSTSEVRRQLKEKYGIDKKKNSFLNEFVRHHKVKRYKDGEKRNQCCYFSEADKDKVIEYFYLYDLRNKINKKARQEAGELTIKMKSIIKNMKEAIQ